MEYLAKPINRLLATPELALAPASQSPARSRHLAIAWLALGPMLMLLPLWSAPTSAGEDDAVFYFPLRVLTGQALSAGDWNAWNPYEQCGMPLFADPQAAVLYPPTWLFAAAAPQLAYSLNIFIAFALAGLGAYAYLRKIALSVLPSAVGATAFQYCGFMVGHRVHLSVIAAAGMLGFGLWAIESLRDRPRRAMLALPWILFIALAAGHWPTFINLMLIWGAYLGLRGRPLKRCVLLGAAALAVALLLIAPQAQATYELLQQTTRQRIGYATFGENSFFPTNGILLFFPLVMGCRTQNFFVQQPWWGAWHLCETLPYVGLLTLMLAGAAVARLCPKEAGHPFSPLARVWGMVAIGAFIWMLGYYLPTYWLIHKIPVLNIVRAPARMVVALDFAFAALAAIGLHAFWCGEGVWKGRMARSLRRWAAYYVPVAMMAALALLLSANTLAQHWFPLKYPGPFAGGPLDANAALSPRNPAVWVPVLMTAAAIITMFSFINLPRARAPFLVAMLVVDLLVVTQSVDIPSRISSVPDPELSPAAELVKELAGDEPFRVLHLTDAYFSQSSEALAPKACGLFGVENLAGYGPFQYRDHAHLFGLRIFGCSREWRQLVRRNYLLSLYNVRYLVVQKPYADMLESVVIDPEPPEEGKNMLAARWPMLTRASVSRGVVKLATPFMWEAATASQSIAGVKPGAVYRIALDARSPDGAANFLQADVLGIWDEHAMVVYPEQMSKDWRHFEWTFQMPQTLRPSMNFCLLTLSETAIEVRNVTLRESAWERPVNLGGRLQAGQSVYEKKAEFDPARPGDQPICVYENRLWLPRSFPVRPVVLADQEQAVEELRWHPERYDLTQAALTAEKNVPAQATFVSEVPRPGDGTAGLPPRANGLGYLGERRNTIDGNKLQAGWAVYPSAGLLLYIAVLLLQGRRLTRPI